MSDISLGGLPGKIHLRGAFEEINSRPLKVRVASFRWGAFGAQGCPESCIVGEAFPRSVNCAVLIKAYAITYVSGELPLRGAAQNHAS